MCILFNFAHSKYDNLCILYNFAQYKMYDITEYILQIRCLNHNNLKEYLGNKLLSIDPCDITHTVFFKKLYVIFTMLFKRIRYENK